MSYSDLSDSEKRSQFLNETGADTASSPLAKWMTQQDAADRAAQQQAYAQARARAQGGGPSIANTQLGAAQDAMASASNAGASSGYGGAPSAARGAIIRGGTGLSALGGQAASARAGEQLQGMSQQAQIGSMARQQDLGSGAQIAGMYGQQAELNQGNAALQQQRQNFDSEKTLQAAKSVAGAGSGMSAGMAADADLQEPGGPAHWTLREEKDFILAKNQRTGELRKLLTAPLDQHEEHQALSQHGAGPLGAEDPRRVRKVAHDMQLGSVKDSYHGDEDPSANRWYQQATADTGPRTHNYSQVLKGLTKADTGVDDENVASMGWSRGPEGTYVSPHDTWLMQNGLSPQTGHYTGPSSSEGDDDSLMAEMQKSTQPTPDDEHQAEDDRVDELLSQYRASHPPQATGGYDKGWDNVSQQPSYNQAAYAQTPRNDPRRTFLRSDMLANGEDVPEDQAPPPQPSDDEDEPAPGKKKKLSTAQLFAQAFGRGLSAASR